MDHIRAAVTKAKSTRPTTSEQPATQKPLIGGVRQAVNQDGFKEVRCDFAGFAKNRIISNEQDPVLNAYRVLRTRVLQKMDENGWKTLAVVSPGPGAGKTVTAINLAIAIGSKLGTRSTLVDLDFYRPRVSKYLGITEPPSILDYFENKQSLHDVTLRPDLPDTLIIANERVSRRGAEHLTSDKADELIARAVDTYQSRAVIFDMSPLLGCDDTIAFLPKVDCVLVVASSGQTRVNELREVTRLLDKQKIAGTILNKAPSVLVSNPYY